MLNPVTDELLAALRAQLPDDTLRAPEPRYLEEPRGRSRGQAAAVALPRSVEDVSTILRYANTARFGVVPYGGGTGLVAGQIASEGPMPLILSLERMNAIRAVFANEDVIEVEAGATLASVQQAAADADRLFPLSYGSEGTAQIGSGLSINSGGVAVLRYGSARDLCLGIEAVLPDGSILHGLKRLRKDNTGYDLRNLLIGSEGTLGIITAATLRLFPQPARRAAALFVVPGPDAGLDLLHRARTIAGPGVSGFELMSGVGLGFIEEAGLQPRWPLGEIPNWAVLIDLGLAGSEDPGAALEEVFADALEAGVARDGVMSQSEAQRTAFWAMRDAIPAANRVIGAVVSHDISVPLSEIAGFVSAMTPEIEALAPLRVNAFGHLGDGNLHYNIFAAPGHDRSEFDDLRPEITRRVHDRVMSLGGSFSAEHGVGRLKAGDLERYGDPAKLAAMRTIKSALDPNGILNPGAVLRMTGDG